MLDRFYTDLSAEVWWLRLAGLLPDCILPPSMKRLLARKIPAVPKDKTTHFSRFGISRILQRDRATGANEWGKHTLAANMQFCSLVQANGLGEANAIYAFNVAALELFRHATSLEMIRILEQTAAPVAFDEKLLAEERKLWPGWEQEFDSVDWKSMAEREKGEWDLADVILCGSDYVARAVASEGGPGKRCMVVPYGVLAVDKEPSPRPSPRILGVGDRPLRVLAVGNITLRKGFQYLMRAMETLKNDRVVCRVVGQVMVNPQARAQLSEQMELAGPVARDQVREHYDWADVLVLPTLSEGSANVCYEALATGLPVITTDHAGSVVRNGIEGFIIPIRSADAIVGAVRKLNSDRDRLSRMSAAALDRAREFTWDAYSRRLVSALDKCFSQARQDHKKAA